MGTINIIQRIKAQLSKVKCKKACDVQQLKLCLFNIECSDEQLSILITQE